MKIRTIPSFRFKVFGSVGDVEVLVSTRLPVPFALRSVCIDVLVRFPFLSSNHFREHALMDTKESGWVFTVILLNTILLYIRVAKIAK